MTVEYEKLGFGSVEFWDMEPRPVHVGIVTIRGRELRHYTTTGSQWANTGRKLRKTNAGCHSYKQLWKARAHTGHPLDSNT